MPPPPRTPENYTLRVTAGPTYDLATHVEIPINSPHLTHISSPSSSSSSTTEAGMDIDLTVRIQNYHRGLPRNSPSTSPYFDREPHRYNRDQYSIGLRFRPRRPGTSTEPTSAKPAGDDGQERDGAGENGEKDMNEKDGIPATDLQFGNDFDHPIRNYLPPGVNTAMNILKWWIDPGLEGDAYADQPYLYGPALSSFNAVRVGKGEEDESKGGLWVEEGASDSEGESEFDANSDDDDDDDDDGRNDKATETGDAEGHGHGHGHGHEKEKEKKKHKKGNGRKSGKQWREEVLAGSGVGNDAKKRQKWALKEDAKTKWVWEYGRTYAVDFYNPYIDFGKCELKLPGFGVNVLRYWDGETGLRYVLRNRLTKKPYLVILFTLYPNDMVNEDGTLKSEALKVTARASGGEKDEQVNYGEKEAVDGGDKFDADKAVEEAKSKLEGVTLGAGEGPRGGAGVGAADDDVD
ncbi:DUF1769-domain-containing protein [Neurospora crassa]|uniref:Domain of unknown function at the cortex 1 domain-containing protein n=1 Tax=Neurospora crassa (strain ATCC 24698 / 74-OR23-1A / CBS 708.71 / DSM 1257 / FGSC 987) TaxID=367110 RepID=Q7S0G2_NEUCR|nr:hypothetical protein NCU09451 [Neurospora crassa OR74A]EAA28801.1 hypothetical protein NCU09451 [Neurospora crassa OR74A]KHE78382.1 DUF1769-domain-containing protein [Neurospora crassa]|eukprot:XP_958037.1 hypothetical protein NCU09451 [Neurospora crassa OR74A]